MATGLPIILPLYQTAINSCTGTCNIILVNAVIGAQVDLPLHIFAVDFHGY